MGRKQQQNTTTREMKVKNGLNRESFVDDLMGITTNGEKINDRPLYVCSDRDMRRIKNNVIIVDGFKMESAQDIPFGVTFFEKIVHVGQHIWKEYNCHCYNSSFLINNVANKLLYLLTPLH
eukprot:8440455-Ditylum_brightwellii.AAC.1